jgi:RND superfamily putative drug exporter
MGGGLDQASAFLLAMKRDAANPPMSGFYIPAEILTQAEFKKAATLFISADGHTARYAVQTASIRLARRRWIRSADHQDRRGAQPNTTLATPKSRWSDSLWRSGIIRELLQRRRRMDHRRYADRGVPHPGGPPACDRGADLPGGIRDPLVPVSGRNRLFFQFILGQQLSWNVPGMAFLVLVAVGADYNLLLISRIRDESQRGIRSGVIKTVGATGGVITSAGLIFSASMFGLTFSSISNIVQVGFIIGVGLLLDTFLVRTITVPAMAVLVGKANWWPSKGPTPNGAENTRPAN